MLTAAVCTRNRGASAVAAIRSLLANDHPQFEVVVVDQSSGPETRDALAPLLSDSRLRYFQTPTVGVSRSRNEAMRLAAPSSEIVCFTDDDCTVPPDWLRTMERIFDQHPHAALVFCNTRAAEHDPKAGFIPAYVRSGTVELQSAIDKCRNRAIGAGMAVRRGPALAIGGFDEALGPGGRFQCCEEGDLAVRTLIAGYRVCETDETEVLHFGFRTWAEGRALTRRDWIGIGAAYSKPLKVGRLRFAVVPLYELTIKALLPPIVDALHLRRPRGVGRIASFINGFVRGLCTPVDPRSVCFIEPPSAP